VSVVVAPAIENRIECRKACAQVGDHSHALVRVGGREHTETVVDGRAARDLGVRH
jgi:hypothetical protein